MCDNTLCVPANQQVPWVLTGHSERRSLCAESNRAVGQKTGHALEVGLQVRWSGAKGFSPRTGSPANRGLDPLYMSEMQGLNGHPIQNQGGRPLHGGHPLGAKGLRVAAAHAMRTASSS